MPETILSEDTTDFIGTATSDSDDHYRAVPPYGGRAHSFIYRKDAVAWLNELYNQSH
jgi:hypothetical protein